MMMSNFSSELSRTDKKWHSDLPEIVNIQKIFETIIK